VNRAHLAFSLATLLAACGGSAPDADPAVPEPGAVAPGAAATTVAEPAAADGAEAQAPAQEAPPAERTESDDPLGDTAVAQGDPQSGVFVHLFGGGTGGLRSSAGTPARWWILVRNPGGNEQRYRTDSRQAASRSAPNVFPDEVAGWRCQLQRAAVQQNVQITGGTRTASHRAERTLVCEKDGQQRSATAVCGYDEDPSGRTPVVTPAELDVGDPRDPHRVTLSCDPPLP